MSLFDIDKSSDNRSRPSLNADDAVASGSRMAHGTFGVTLVDTSSNVVARLVIVDGKLEIYNASNERMTRGGVRESDSDGAFDVAKPGQTL